MQEMENQKQSMELRNTAEKEFNQNRASQGQLQLEKRNHELEVELRSLKNEKRNLKLQVDQGEKAIRDQKLCFSDALEKSAAHMQKVVEEVEKWNVQYQKEVNGLKMTISKLM